MPDIDLLIWDRVKSGDAGAYEILFRKYYAGLCLFAKQYTLDMSLAKEVVQDLFLYLWEYRRELAIHTSVKSYLYRAVRFNSIRKHENERKWIIPMDMLPESDDGDFFDNMEYAELQEKILDAIESLPEQCQKIFKLSRFEQMKYAEIATHLNLSVKTIEAQMSKALKIVQQALTEL
jgi:RNA polymerase sigma-70 factor, ECF subfamily